MYISIYVYIYMYIWDWFLKNSDSELSSPQIFQQAVAFVP